MIHFIEHIVMHTIEDTLSLLPFLFMVFLALEYMEHSLSHRTQQIVENAGKAGPLLGGVLGAAPQCGFSVMATNLFAGRVATAGTLVAVYLSTSDEMLAIMMSHQLEAGRIFRILGVKAVIGILAGFAVDMLIKPTADHNHISQLCEQEHCGCGHSSPFVSAVRHTISIFAVIAAVTLVLNGVIEAAGLEKITAVVADAGMLAPVLACLVGFIPNCAASVVLTELYMAQAITFGTAMAGLLAGSGVAWVVLMRTNHNIKENAKIIGIVFAVSAVSGIMFNAMNISF